MHATPHRRLARPGFTLVELLTVIVIIAVLAAILVPVTLNARASARASRCVANLRQIGVAVQLYAGEHRGALPYMTANGTSVISRAGMLAPFFGPFHSGTPLDAYFRAAPVLCPADGREPATLSYVSNVHYIGFPAGGYRQRRLNEVTRPATKIAMAEGERSFAATDGPYVRAWSSPDVLTERHRNKLNVLFMDAHVSALSIAEITVDHVRFD